MLRHNMHKMFQVPGMQQLIREITDHSNLLTCGFRQSAILVKALLGILLLPPVNKKYLLMKDRLKTHRSNLYPVAMGAEEDWPFSQCSGNIISRACIQAIKQVKRIYH